MEKGNTDSFIKKSLENIEVQPAISSFDSAMKKVAAQQKKKNRFLFFWWFVGIGCVGAIALFLFQGKTSKEISMQFNANQFKDSLEEVRNTKVKSTKESDNNKQIQSTSISNTKVEDANTSAAKKHESDLIVTNKQAENISAPNEKVKVTHKSITKKPARNLTATKTHNTTVQNLTLGKSILNSNTSQATLGINESELKYLTLKMKEMPTLIQSKHIDSAEMLRGITGIVETKELLKDTSQQKVKKKAFVWYVGIGFNPQATRYELQKNANGSSVYENKSGDSFGDFYLENRRKQQKITFAYNALLKGGFIYNKKWMLHAALGYQTLKYKEEIIKLDTLSNSPPIVTTLTPLTSTATFAITTNPNINSYRYINLSLEACRLFDLKYFGVKTGLGVSVANLWQANTTIVDSYNMYSYKNRYSDAPLNKWMYNVSFKLGVLKHITPRIQLQATPNIFYNVNSMFNKTYLITQKPYGAGLDMSLLIRLN
jgi:hypothetical protein